MDYHSSDLNTILTRLLEIALDLGRYQKHSWDTAVPSPKYGDDDGFDDGFDVARAGLVGIARRLLKEADAREVYFPHCVSPDPVWSILLDLYIKAAEGEKVVVTDACIASRAPATTALRWIGEMVDRGMVIRTPDSRDRRRAYLALSDEVFANMSRYLAGIAGIVSVATPTWAPRAKPKR